MGRMSVTIPDDLQERLDSYCSMFNVSAGAIIRISLSSFLPDLIDKEEARKFSELRKLMGRTEGWKKIYGEYEHTEDS